MDGGNHSLATSIFVDVAGTLFGQNPSMSTRNIEDDRFVVLADAEQWRLGPRRTYVLGKIISYRLNAYDDYSIADIITGYVASGALPGGEDEIRRRARDFINDAGNARDTPEKQQRLLVYAFTLRWLNGYEDLMWARFLEKCFIIRPRITGTQYTEGETGKIDLFYWTFVGRGETQPIVDFASKYSPFTLSPDAIAEEIIHVQYANSDANLRTRSAILGEETDGIDAANNGKANLIREVAGFTQFPNSFLRGAANGQSGAKRWDGLFISLCRRALARKNSR